MINKLYFKRAFASFLTLASLIGTSPEVLAGRSFKKFNDVLEEEGHYKQLSALTKDKCSILTYTKKSAVTPIDYLTHLATNQPDVFTNKIIIDLTAKEVFDLSTTCKALNAAVKNDPTVQRLIALMRFVPPLINFDGDMVASQQSFLSVLSMARDVSSYRKGLASIPYGELEKYYTLVTAPPNRDGRQTARNFYDVTNCFFTKLAVRRFPLCAYQGMATIPFDFPPSDLDYERMLETLSNMENEQCKAFVSRISRLAKINSQTSSIVKDVLTLHDLESTHLDTLIDLYEAKIKEGYTFGRFSHDEDDVKKCLFKSLRDVGPEKAQYVLSKVFEILPESRCHAHLCSVMSQIDEQSLTHIVSHGSELLRHICSNCLTECMAEDPFPSLLKSMKRMKADKLQAVSRETVKLIPTKAQGICSIYRAVALFDGVAGLAKKRRAELCELAQKEDSITKKIAFLYTHKKR